MTIDKLKCHKKIIDYILVFIFCSFSRFIFIPSLQYGVPSSDEVSAISVAALLAGYNWSGVVSNAGYYGIGYLWMFFPLFKLGLEAELIYKIICGASAILIGLTGCVCYRIVDEFCGRINRIENFFLSTFAGCLSVLCTYVFSERNEEALLLVSWLITYVMFSIGYKGNSKKKQVALMGLMLYSLTLHSRAIMYIIAFVIFVIIYAVIYKKLFIKWQSMVAFFALCYLIKFGIKEYQNLIWGIDGIRNASIVDALGSGVAASMFSFKGMLSMIMIIVGHIFTAIEMTGGTYVLALFTILVCLALCLKKKIDYKNPILWIGSYWMLCSIAITLGQSISWRSGVYAGITSGSYDWVYGFKALTYMRYPGPFIPPFILCGLLLLLDLDSKTKRIISGCTCVMALLCTIFWKMIIEPYAINQNIDVMYFLSRRADASGWVGWQKTYLLVVFFGLLWIFLVNKKRMCWNVFFISTAVFMISIKINVFKNYTNPFNSNFVGCVKETADYLNYIKDDLPEETTIHVVDNSDWTDHQTWYRLQYLCYDVRIVPGIEGVDENDIIVSNVAIEDLYNKGFIELELTPCEYIYIYKDSDLEAMSIEQTSKMRL